MLKARGYNGTVTLDDDLLTITRTGLAARTLIGGGSKVIPLNQVVAVQFVPAKRWLFRGFIQFTIAGGIEQRQTFGRRTKAAHHDENTVMFNHRQQVEFGLLHAVVRSAMAVSAR